MWQPSVTEFKDQSWFVDSFAALQDEWAGHYQTDDDMAALWTREMKFYFKHFGAREAAYHERTRDLPVRITPLKVFNEREAPTMDLRPHLKNIKVPTLVIVGRHDFITNVAMAEEMVKHIPTARLEIFEDSGHFAVIEEPEKFYQVVKQFVVNEPMINISMINDQWRTDCDDRPSADSLIRCPSVDTISVDSLPIR